MQAFIEKLEELNLFLLVKDGDLVLKARKGKLSDDDKLEIRKDASIVDFIKENKKTLIEYLNNKRISSDAEVFSNYPLCSMQQSMLFHSLYDEESGAYTDQIIISLEGAVDQSVLKTAINLVFKKHTVLRSAFNLEIADVPMQSVYEKVEVPFQEFDISSLTNSSKNIPLQEIIDTERLHRFDLKKPPLSRFLFIPINANESQLVWTYHHVLLDGRSTVIVIEEIVSFYKAILLDKFQENSIDSYESYIHYLSNRDIGKEKKFWTRYFDDFTTETSLPFRKGSYVAKSLVSSRRNTIQIDEISTREIHEFARLNRLTLPTIVQGIWSLLLSAYTGSSNCVFGVTVSVRPQEMSDIDNRVGLFINTIPLKTETNDYESITRCFSKLQTQHSNAREFQDASLSEIKSWIDHRGNLYDSIIVFDHNSLFKSDLIDSEGNSLNITHVKNNSNTNYPLTIAVKLSPTGLEIQFNYYESIFSSEHLDKVAFDYKRTFEYIVRNPSSLCVDIKNLLHDDFCNIDNYKKFGFWRGLYIEQAKNNKLPKDFICLSRNSKIKSFSQLGYKKTFAIDSTLDLQKFLTAVSVALFKWSNASELNIDVTQLQIRESARKLVSNHVLPLLKDEKKTLQQCVEKIDTHLKAALDYPLELDTLRSDEVKTCAAVTSINSDSSMALSDAADLASLIKHDLNFFIYNGKNEIEFGICFDSLIFHHQTIQSLLEYIEQIISLINENSALITNQINENIFLTEQTKANRNRHVAINLLSTFTIDPAEEYLSFLAGLSNRILDLEKKSYLGIIYEIQDSKSSLYRSDIHTVLFIRWEDLAENAWKNEPQKILFNGLIIIDYIKSILHRLRNVTIYICEPSKEVVKNPACNNIIQTLNSNIRSICINSSVTLIEMKALLDLYSISLEDVWESGNEYQIPYNEYGYAALSVSVWRVIYKDLHPVYKVIAVDCDNTLWKGVCAELGPSGVTITQPFLFLQQFLKDLKSKGFLLVICSKNINEDVDRVFEENSKMILSKSDFVLREINWAPKSENLVKLSNALNLDLNSFIFIDDDPIQCEEVRNALPQVKILKIPSDENLIPNVLQKTWMFDVRDLALEVDRTNTYQTEVLRKHAFARSSDPAEFLKEMGLEIEFENVTSSHFHRISEMSLRINQFNITGSRYGVEEVEAFFCFPNRFGFNVSAKDKFGDYGTIGSVLYEIADTNVEIHSFLLSCRALGREIEFKILNHLGEIATLHKKDTIHFNFKSSARNGPAKTFIESIAGFNTIETTYARGARQKHDNIFKSDDVSVAPKVYHTDIIHSMLLNECMCDLNKLISECSPSVDLDNAIIVDPNGVKLEATLIDIWKKLLNRSDISITDDFFKIGGHSLLAIRLVSIVKKRLNVELQLKTIFENKTINDLTAILRKPIHVQDNRISVSRPLHIPLSFSQERIWFIDKFEGSVQYHIPIVLKINGNLNISALNESFRREVLYQEIFRTNYYETDEGEVFQKIDEHKDWNIEFEAGESWDDEFVETKINETISTKFDLSIDSILRVKLIKTGVDEFVLIIVIHHIGFDGWSQQLLLKHLVTNYNALVRNTSLEKLSHIFQYADFAVWQRETIVPERMEASLRYWESKLEGIPNLKLPVDFEKRPTQIREGGLAQSMLDYDLVKKLQAISNSVGGTMFVTLFSAFNILLNKYTGVDNVCVGTPVANRSQSEFEGIIGFMTNTLAINTKVRSEYSFKEFLSLMKGEVIGAFEHQEVPFEHVVNRVVKGRSSAYSPLFQVMFVMHEGMDKYYEMFDGISISKKKYAHNTSIFDLTMQVEIQGEEIKISMEYGRDIFLHETIVRFMNSFLQLLRAITLNIEMRIAEWHAISKEDIAVITNFNNTGHTLGDSKSVINLLEKQFKYFSESTAVACPQFEFTYRQLNEKSNQFARYLRSIGLKKADSIAVIIDRSSWSAVVMLGILKSGCVYVPIDPTYPENRIQFILENCSAKRLILNTPSDTPVSRSNLITFLGDGSFLKEFDETDLLLDLELLDPSYIIYTSGSTGVPKGVVQTHMMLCNLIQWGLSRSGLLHGQRYLQYSSFCFDSSIHDILFAIASGGTAYIVSEVQRKDFWLLKGSIVENRIGTVSMPYSAMKTLFDSCSSSDFSGHMISEIISTGEALYINGGLREFLIDNPQVKIFNLYGPSETHVVTGSSYQFAHSEESLPVSASIGKPIDNTSIHILDENRLTVPIGVVGEIYIGGYNLAQGYKDNNLETEQRFVIVNVEGKEIVLYKTGDLGRWKLNGDLDFLGRIDNQVKIRGYRIEVDEVENTLQQCPYVLGSTVVAQIDVSGNINLIGYVKLKKEENIQAVELFLRSSLPEYMVPRMFIDLQQFPVTPNGKIDKTRLPPPKFIEHQRYVAPISETELLLVRIWADALQINSAKISIQDNFFELGGHSLLITKVAAAIRREFKLIIPIKILFQLSNVGDLAKYIEILTAASKYDRAEYNYIDL